MAALLNAGKADPTLTGIRNYALIALLYNAGLRRSELVALDWADLEARGALTIQQGKGREARIVYLSRDVAAALMAWRSASVENTEAMFRVISKAKQVLARRLTDQAIWYLLDRRAAQADIPAVRPHDDDQHPARSGRGPGYRPEDRWPCQPNHDRPL